ncbi:MAG: class I tRNA ligase family protein, partial [Saprospiraceae bacterium]|nr:class I tRNA ligase family protein [Saprospiraceae bacterium]
LMSSAAAGNDILFDEKLCENGRNFCNKLWNALRLIKGWQTADQAESEAAARKNALAVRWMREKFQAVLADMDANFKAFRLSEALLSLYSFIWDDFCSWYLEMIKPGFEKPIDRATREATLDLFSELMVALHPFMPFITEEIWHQLRERAPGDDCMMQRYPQAGTADAGLIARVEAAKDIIAKVRDLRNQNQLKPREELDLLAQKSASAEALFAEPGLKEMVQKLAVLSSLEWSAGELPANAKSFISGADKYYVLLTQQIDVAAERAKLEQELEYQRGFLRAIEAKLSNERFVQGAPAAVVDNERRKQADAQTRIKSLEESLAALS